MSTKIAVNALDLLDLVQVLEPRDALVEFVEALFGGLLGEGGDGEKGQSDREKAAPHHFLPTTSSGGCGMSLSDWPVTGCLKSNGGM